MARRIPSSCRSSCRSVAVVVVSQVAGLLLLLMMLPFFPHATPGPADLLWGALAGVTGGGGVALLYRALAIGVMAVVAPITAVCAVVIPICVSVALGGRPAATTFGGIAKSPRIPAAILGIVVAAGALDMLANLLYLVASRAGPLSVFVTLASLYPASTVLLARLVLHERLGARQWAGVACALVAVAVIVR
jgi:uncharacterized membrane protein